jgi:plastocyanin
MTFNRYRFWFAALLLTAATSLQSATHDVTIGDNFFSPNDLTIEVGDTVRWTYDGGRMHDVTADDLSWSSPTSTSISYERTFNTVAEVLYHCSVHSAPGRNIDTSMNGRITVTEATGGFLINPAMSDAWFYPLTSGQGFFIIVWEDIELIFLSWFTYDTERPPEDVQAILGEPGHRWLTAQGPFSGDTAMLDVFLSQGGVFDAADPVVEPPQMVGSITITWSGCNAGLLTYDLPNLSLNGEIPIERVVLDKVPACESYQAAE